MAESLYLKVVLLLRVCVCVCVCERGICERVLQILFGYCVRTAVYCFPQSVVGSDLNIKNVQRLPQMYCFLWMPCVSFASVCVSVSFPLVLW